MDLFVRNVVVDGVPCDVLVRDGRVVEIGEGLRPSGHLEVLEGANGSLLPGLHDHHLHLLATAAARSSVDLGPGPTPDARSFHDALRRADGSIPAGGWLRAVGYHDSIAGPLDRHRLDAVLPDRPTRVQHRSGALWVLSSRALAELDLTGGSPDGAEVDATGALTGRFHRADRWLRAHLPPQAAPDLAAIGAELAGFGITGVTDATPFETLDEVEVLDRAVESGALPQRVTLMGGLALAKATLPGRLLRGPVKIILDDHDLPSLQDLTGDIATAHRLGRPVAIHCVTGTSLTLALVAWQSGCHPGDRVEHGSVIPPDLRSLLAALGLTVVTQPGFTTERGDQYLADVDAADLPHLYPCRSLLQAGIPVAASSDAPYTSLDPWAGMRSAVTRTTPLGRVIGDEEVVSPVRALRLYQGEAVDPGGPRRRIALGQPADLCLLEGPEPTSIDDLRADRVVATVIAGRVAHHTFA